MQGIRYTVYWMNAWGYIPCSWSVSQPSGAAGQAEPEPRTRDLLPTPRGEGGASYVIGASESCRGSRVYKRERKSEQSEYTTNSKHSPKPSMAFLPQDRPLDAVTGQEHHFVTVPSDSQPQQTQHAAVQPIAVQPVAVQPEPVLNQPTAQSAALSTTQPVAQAPQPARPQPKRVPTAVITRADGQGEPTNQGGVPEHAIKHTVHVPNAPGAEASVVPATQAGSAPDHALPTAPNVHPEVQEREIEEVGKRDPGLVAAQVEKTRADRRQLKGKEEGGTVVQGIEDDKLWALLRRFDTVSRAERGVDERKTTGDGATITKSVLNGRKSIAPFERSEGVSRDLKDNIMPTAARSSWSSGTPWILPVARSSSLQDVVRRRAPFSGQTEFARVVGCIWLPL